MVVAISVISTRWCICYVCLLLCVCLSDPG